MTGSDFYAYVLRVFKRTDKSTEAYEAMTDVVMDVKLRYFFEDFKVEAYSAAIVSLGDWRLSLPSDFGHLIGNVRLIDNNGSSRELNKLTVEAFKRKYPNNDGTDVIRALPEDFCVYSGQILLGSVPDSIDYNYQIDYSTEAAEVMSSGTLNVPFTDRYRWIMRELVLAELYDGVSQFDEGSRHKKKGEDGIQLMIANDDWNVDASMTQDYSDN